MHNNINEQLTSSLLQQKNHNDDGAVAYWLSVIVFHAAEFDMKTLDDMIPDAEKRACAKLLVDSINDSPCSESYIKLGILMGHFKFKDKSALLKGLNCKMPDEVLQLGEDYMAAECFMRAVELDPKCCAWYWLAVGLIRGKIAIGFGPDNPKFEGDVELRRRVVARTLLRRFPEGEPKFELAQDLLKELQKPLTVSAQGLRGLVEWTGMLRKKPRPASESFSTPLVTAGLALLSDPRPSKTTLFSPAESAAVYFREAILVDGNEMAYRYLVDLIEQRRVTAIPEDFEDFKVSETVEEQVAKLRKRAQLKPNPNVAPNTYSGGAYHQGGLMPPPKSSAPPPENISALSQGAPRVSPGSSSTVIKF